MNLLQRKMPKDEPDRSIEALDDMLQCGRRLLAVGALKVAVLHNRDCRMREAEHVIRGTDGIGEIVNLR
jgi:hypothetical protein